MSLAQITREIRISSKIIGALLGVGIIIFLFFQGGIFIQKVFFPKPPAPPEEKFGKLPEIIFPETPLSNFEYRVNTVSGKLPVFSDRIRVYKLAQNETSITALKTARDDVSRMGFIDNQTAVTTSSYSWTNPETQSILTLNIVSRNFTITSDLSSNPLFATGKTLTQENAIENTTQIINTLGGNTQDLDFSKTRITNAAIQNGVFIDSDPLLQQQATKITLFQNPVDKIPIYYPIYDDSILFFYLSFINGKTEAVEASYIHKYPNLNDSSTYPLKSTTQAFEELKNGKGFIVNPTTDDIVDITDVSLGYYIDESPDQEYLIPIIVFQGKNNFEAYVQATP